MKLILAHYLRTLRERDEFDRLLPELVIEMGYVPLAKPQTGVRQFGVDFAAVGKSAEDGTKEILLFVIKQNDIGRSEWHGDPKTSVYPTLVEVLDVYLTTHLAPEHAPLRKVVIVATTGDFKQDIQLNWKGFVESNQSRAEFQFWNGDHVAGLLERHLLNENLFAAQDRQDLRKALALAGDRDYDFSDLLKILRRQLGINHDGSLSQPALGKKQLIKAIRCVNLATQVCAHWAQTDGNRKQALWMSERALLWTWHRIQLANPEDQQALCGPFGEIWTAYLKAAKEYVQVMQPHFAVRDGMSGYCRENAEFSLVLFEHIGLLATVGLCQMLTQSNSDEVTSVRMQNADIVAEALSDLIRNNGASSSPRLDRHVTDICLALIFFEATNRYPEASEWLTDIAYRLNFSFLRKRMFPIGTDSLDDLVDFEVNGDDESADKLMRTSWTLATVAAWCALRGLNAPYLLLAQTHAKEYPSVCAQLWHPTADWPEQWYYQATHYELGDTEAPYMLPEDPADLCTRIEEFLRLERYDWAVRSPAAPVGLWALDFIACRHFQMPVPASFWYQVARIKNISDVSNSGTI